MPAGSIAAFLAALDPGTRATVDALRATVVAAAPALIEEFKWNAPSFRDAQDHKVTLGIERKGGVRLVLHRGAAVKETHGFRFDDPAGLARWAAPDRGVIVFENADDVAARRAALADLIARWIAATV